ncbi:hypothetical protein D5S18_18630 [Nocardia panacis]|uniref:HK97 gp10 family phage protein n=1 Tax=Nocardia panacis TaxID=2340916 RepID=A0A3A4KK38_9NOCA|nr:hypothetical protein [Nocardia panacis]RJO74170.1 hypothetical protein D5S18_18630 [Nocardia panacis]
MAELTNIRIPKPNPALAKILRGPQMKTLVTRKGLRARAIYAEVVAKRTGELAASARVETVLGGLHGDRWIARVRATAPHAASHEYGTGRTDPAYTAPAAHDMIKVLEALDIGS